MNPVDPALRADPHPLLARLRAYDPGDLLALAREAGLADDGVFGSLWGGRWAPPDPVVLVVRRPEPVHSVQVPSASGRVST